MKYAIEILDKQRRDHLATANAIELRMAKMLDPHTEATADTVRKHRLQAEELQKAIAVLGSSDVVNIEDVR